MLSATECHYSTVEKEGLGCLWAVEKSEKYLLGRPFTLHTDQHALRQILGSPLQAESKRNTSKSICWAERLAAYDFMLVYRPGKDNSVPDMLSHLPLPSTGDALADGYTDCLISQICPHGISFTEVQQCTTADTMLQSVCHYINSYWPNKSTISAELWPCFHVHICGDLTLAGDLS